MGTRRTRPTGEHDSLGREIKHAERTVDHPASASGLDSALAVDAAAGGSGLEPGARVLVALSDGDPTPAVVVAAHPVTVVVADSSTGDEYEVPHDQVTAVAPAEDPGEPDEMSILVAERDAYWGQEQRARAAELIADLPGDQHFDPDASTSDLMAAARAALEDGSLFNFGPPTATEQELGALIAGYDAADQALRQAYADIYWTAPASLKEGPPL